MSSQRRQWFAAPRFMSLTGALVGLAGALVYWTAAQLWPSSIAVVLAMLATALLGGLGRVSDQGALTVVFAILVKYNALMALSTASLAFAVPADVALGVIMIAGHAAGSALAVSALPASSGCAPVPGASAAVSHVDLALALIIGFAPATLLGVPGLSGLIAAILVRIGHAAWARRNPGPAAAQGLTLTRPLAEICFYLGVLAARAYI